MSSSHKVTVALLIGSATRTSCFILPAPTFSLSTVTLMVTLSCLEYCCSRSIELPTGGQEHDIEPGMVQVWCGF